MNLIRLATLDDVERIFAWRNDQWLVSFSTSRQPVTREEHNRWMQKILNSAEHLLFVIEPTAGGVGTVRVDLHPGNHAVISIYLLREFTGKGLGVQAIGAACAEALNRWPIDSIRAYIRKGNRASVSAFYKAGFATIESSVDCPPEHVQMILRRKISGTSAHPLIVSINQPAYLPWLGYFHRIAVSDLHIVLDHVQFEKNSFTNRNKIRTGDGSCWLTVPLKTKGRFGQLNINTVEIDNHQNWREKHWRAIQQNYGKSPHFAEHAAFFESVYRREWALLADLCREVTSYLLKCFGIAAPLRYSSSMAAHETKSALVLELCQKVGAKIYLSGSLGRNYLDESAFAGAGITVVYQEFKHPRYEQFRRKDFEPCLAAIDLLFNCGEESRAVLMENQEPIIE